MNPQTATTEELRTHRDRLYTRRAALNTEIHRLEEALLRRTIDDAARRDGRPPC